MAIDWGILRSNGPVDIAANFTRGYEIADKIISRVHEKNALGALAANPDDRNALGQLYRANPELGARMETMNMKRHDVARETDARNALGHIVTRIGSQQFPEFRQPNAVTGTMPEPNVEASAMGPGDTSVVAEAARDVPGSAVAAPSATGDTVPAPDAAPPPGEDDITITAKRPEAPAEVHPDMAEDWRAYAEADPEGAMKTMIDRHKLNKEQAVDLAAQMDIIGRLAGSATDAESYGRALQYGQALGYDISRLPKDYSPEAVQQIQQQSMTAKDAIKQKWDIQDDEIDNARADRALQLREQIAGQESSDRRRGQDLSHADRVRGQDVSATTTRRGQDLKPTKGGKPAAGSIPHVKSVAEARALPPGTMFVDPQGNVRRR